MPELDSNIILSAGKGVQPFNPLGVMQSVQGLQNAQAQNALLQNENTKFGQQQAAGKIVANALLKHTTPAGAVDYSGVRADLAAQGGDNPYIADAVTQNLAQQGGQTANETAAQGLDQARVKTARDHLALTASILSPLVTKPDLSYGDLTSAAADWVGHGDNGDPSAANAAAGWLANIPKDATPDQLRGAVKSLQLQAASSADQLEAAYPGAAMMNTGGKIVPVSTQRFAPGGPAVTDLSNPAAKPNTPIATTLTPGEVLGAKMARTQSVDASGAPISLPSLSVAGKSVATGLAPGVQEAAVAGAGRAQAIQEAAATAAPRIAAMQSVRGEIDNAPNAAFGPTSHTVSEVGKLAQALGVAPPAVVNGQVAVESLGKSLSLIAANQAQQLGAGTDASRAAVAAANPSLANSKEGVRQLISVVQGNEQFGIAKSRALQAAQQQGLTPAQTRAFEAQFNQEVSPLVFQTQLMTPAARAQVYKSLSPAQQKALVAGRALALKYGWFEGQ